MATSKHLTKLVYRVKLALWPPFRAAEITRIVDEERARAAYWEQLCEERRNRPHFTCPVCSCHLWSTGHINDDGSAKGYCRPNMFMKPCKFSWMRPFQDAEVGLAPYDLKEMAEFAKYHRLKEESSRSNGFTYPRE